MSYRYSSPSLQSNQKKTDQICTLKMVMVISTPTSQLPVVDITSNNSNVKINSHAVDTYQNNNDSTHQNQNQSKNEDGCCCLNPSEMTVVSNGIQPDDTHITTKTITTDADTYQFLVLDSGPIIKRFYSTTTAGSHSSSSNNGLWNSSTTNANSTTTTRIWEKAKCIYTVPAVINEIRDANARQYLQSLPFEMIVREPQTTSVQHMIQFAKLTGDYPSLSHTDLQVLALLYDLELIGCRGNTSHIRTIPKRTLGLGKIQSLNKNPNNHKIDTTTATATTTASQVVMSANSDCINLNDRDMNTIAVAEVEQETTTATTSATATVTNILEEKDYIIEVDDDDDDDDETYTLSNENDASNDIHESNEECETVPSNRDNVSTTATQPQNHAPKSWASILSPSATSQTATIPTPTTTTQNSIPVLSSATHNPGQPKFPPEELSNRTRNKSRQYNDSSCDVARDGGQFSDASEDDSDNDWSDDDDDDDDEGRVEHYDTNDTLARELQSDFPSLAAAASTAALSVPYDDRDDKTRSEVENDEINIHDDTNTVETTCSEERKLKSLQPISKSGKMYNSFTKYKDLMKPKQKGSSRKEAGSLQALYTPTTLDESDNGKVLCDEPITTPNHFGSRIIGTSSGCNGPMDNDFDDDGEGWITTTKDISKMKAAGIFDPSRKLIDNNGLATNNTSNKNDGPHISQRAACVTTDFAMQNVILQMNLELLSLDGIRVRKLKNWVTRCGACYTVYTNTDTNNVVGPLGKRLFCEKCGSDLMQRIAASVDSKTGRLRLHLSKKYQYNLRGTKFSLPKPGSGNRFHGDLLLREDQLLMGAWNQKLKMISGGKARDAAQSIFGRDIATNVGCHANAVSMDDIRVGFGRHNPNAAKGRERRGKKKKSVNTACGLRRY
jgi:RNA-binding protein NOB1